MLSLYYSSIRADYCVMLVSHLQRTGLQDLIECPIYRPKDDSCWVNRLEFLQGILSQWGQITKALRTTDDEVTQLVFTVLLWIGVGRHLNHIILLPNEDAFDLLWSLTIRGVYCF